MHLFRPVRRRGAALVVASLACVLCATAAAKPAHAAKNADKHAAQSLRSPWDLHPVTLTSAKYDCPTLPPLPHDIVAYDYYSDAKHSITDPKRHAAYQAAARPFLAIEEATEHAADNYQSTGSREAAACVAQLLVQQAQANAMTGSMSSNQAYYVQNWAIGALAVVWLKVRPAGAAALGVTPAQTAVLQAWMKTVAGQVEDYFGTEHEKGAGSGRNNHYYWAGFSVMAAGIAANDRSLYDWGAGTYKFGVDQIAPDGTLPLEMARGQRALHYHLFAIAPLVTMAELASANGDDLYAYDDSRIHLLVSRTVDGLADNHFFQEKSGVPQDTPENGVVKGSDISWLPPYARRFPDPAFTALLNRAPAQPEGYLGGMPPP
ncbi:Poly(Beta-D-mannuronate) lyase [Candidatus Sulfotelmatomonas gaucii]|uniref:Poly(Beta-D-mannuronate) lyase n=1 Tax=Candidatus Sulfuritelmatomonas gaucii TaxID=2043161 RepID=A0A2N9LJI7_9BACT|nr:Poly(Beta-D-mannuronate) lyase [Candidatus Sulfotelmatomonas gaucii]